MARLSFTIEVNNTTFTNAFNVPNDIALSETTWNSIFHTIRETVDNKIGLYGHKKARTTDETLKEVKKLHRPKYGETISGEQYVICDYDHTPWPCKTERIIQGDE